MAAPLLKTELLKTESSILGVKNAELNFHIFGSMSHSAQNILFLPESRISSASAELLMCPFAKESRILTNLSELPIPENVLEYNQLLELKLENLKVKRMTVLGIGSGAAVALALAISAPTLVRRLVLLDATARLHPGILTRTIDAVERFLPLGLPLRQLSKAFDARPSLHRVRCPTLILSSSRLGNFLQSQTFLFLQKIPNAYSEKLSHPVIGNSGAFSDELLAAFNRFLLVPTKRPQKALLSVKPVNTIDEMNDLKLVKTNI